MSSKPSTAREIIKIKSLLLLPKFKLHPKRSPKQPKQQDPQGINKLKPHLILLDLKINKMNQRQKRVSQKQPTLKLLVRKLLKKLNFLLNSLVDLLMISLLKFLNMVFGKKEELLKDLMGKKDYKELCSKSSGRREKMAPNLLQIITDIVC